MVPLGSSAPAAGLETLRFLPMGLACDVQSDSAAILAAARRSLGGFGAPRPGVGAALTLRLRQLDGGVAGVPVAPSLRRSGRQVEVAAPCGSRLVIDQGAGQARGAISRAVLADAPFFRWHYLELALSFLLEARGFLGVHGAAVAERGRGLLLRAPSGQGKSTLAYAAARRRFQAVAEDVVWIDTRHRRWWGTPWSFHLLPDARRLFPELAGCAAVRQVNGEEKLPVDLEAVRPGSTAPSAEPGAVVLLERRAGAPSRLVAAASEAARAAWRRGAARREAEAPGYAACVDALLSLPTFHLELGDDLDAALDLLATLL